MTIKQKLYGHGGMDWLVYCAFIETVKNEAYPPINVYDTTTYMAITPLSQSSLENNSNPVDFPDFSKEKWQQKDTSKILPEFLLD